MSAHSDDELPLSLYFFLPPVLFTSMLHKPGREAIFPLFFLCFENFFLTLAFFFLLAPESGLVLPVVFCTSLYYSRLILISFIFSCFREPLSDAVAVALTLLALECVGVSGKAFWDLHSPTLLGASVR